MRHVTILATSLTLALSTAALAASTPSPSEQSAEAARKATAAAQKVDIALESRTGANGKVTLQRIGRTRTRVTVTIPGGTDRTITLHRGTDCTDPHYAGATAIALAPMNSTGANPPVSETIVELPLETLTSRDYVVDVRNATTRREFAEACARLNH